MLAVSLQIQIRPAQESDLDALEWYGYQRMFRPHIAAVLTRRERGETELLVAVANGFPVGRLGLDFTRRPETTLLWTFAVIPHLQGFGIGTALIEAAEHLARERGFETVDIDVGKDNPRAQALYERLGYEVVGENQADWSYIDETGKTVAVHDDDWVLRKRV